MACEALSALFGRQAQSTWANGRTELSQCSRHTVNNNPRNHMKTNRIIAGWLTLPALLALNLQPSTAFASTNRVGVLTAHYNMTASGSGDWDYEDLNYGYGLIYVDIGSDQIQVSISGQAQYEVLKTETNVIIGSLLSSSAQETVSGSGQWEFANPGPPITPGSCLYYPYLNPTNVCVILTNSPGASGPFAGTSAGSFGGTCERAPVCEWDDGWTPFSFKDLYCFGFQSATKAESEVAGFQFAITNSAMGWSETLATNAPGYISFLQYCGNGTGDATATNMITLEYVPDQPTVQYTADPASGPVPLKVNFESQQWDSGGTFISRYVWDFGDGGRDFDAVVSHTYTNAGDFTISLVCTNGLGQSVPGVGPTTIHVELPTVQYTATPTNGPIPLTVHFTSTNADSAGTNITEWHWNFNDGATSGEQNPTHTYTYAADFTVSLEVVNASDLTIEASGPTTISAESPTVQFTANPTIGLVPLAVQFNCPSVDSCTNRITVWRWDFDDGGRSTNQNPPPHVFRKAGRYYPNLDATNANGDAVDGSGPSIVVASHSGLVINGDFETGDFFAWTSGGMNNYSTVGTNDGEVNSGEYGAQLVGMSFSVNTLSQTLVTTPGTNYLLSFWLDNPPGNNLNQLTVSWGGNTVWGVTNLAAPGWTNVQVTVTASATNSVLQFAFEPMSYFGLDDVDVENAFVRFTATPAAGVAPLPVLFTSPTYDNNHKTISGWYWDFGDGAASTAPIPTHTYLAAGKFMPQLTATNSDGGTVIGVGPAVVVSLPAAQFDASPASGGAPLPVQFAGPANDSGGNAITHWSWDFGDGAASAAQNPLHTYTRSGNFSPALVVTDNYGVTLAATGPAITVLRVCGLVLNGGFEGGFSGWTCGGNFDSCYVGSGSAYAHSGSYGAQVGPSGSLGYLSQTLATTPGANYRLSLWLDSPDGATPNEFSVSWNGTVLFDQASLAAIGWTNLQFLVTATGASTVLQLGFRDDVHYLGLDDISVMPAILPQPGLGCVTCAGANLVLGGNNGMGGGTYRVLMSTDLARPLNQWTPIATNCPDGGGDFTITLTNAVHSYAPQRFYILQAQ